jgi:molybdopterin/thiamine biosynthesis adenylyltransferase
MKELNIVIVGLGGVGTILAAKLGRFLNYSREYNGRIMLVDGDQYEPKNFERQEFSSFGNKADVKRQELLLQFNDLVFETYEAYINETNAHEAIRDGSIVFLCVDNHKTRSIISNYCKTLTNITLISGGNEMTDGNVQIYVRKGGKDLTPDLSAYHPEIRNPEDKLPDEMSCEELAHSEPQLYFANLGVATLMCFAFYNTVVLENVGISDAYFDMLTMKTNSQIRILK